MPGEAKSDYQHFPSWSMGQFVLTEIAIYFGFAFSVLSASASTTIYEPT